MDLPNLSRLSINTDAVREKWLKACGERPDFRSWSLLKRKDKRILLHDVANMADDDIYQDGDYVSAYEQVDIDDMFAGRRQWSVEHVVSRSHINGGSPHPAEDDPIGWVEATPYANSSRSNHPLYLWLDPPGLLAFPRTLVRVDGELHYVPPMEQRARLARKWLFIRATYKDVDPPSMAQVARASKIVALAQHFPVQPAELRVNADYRERLGWANPLLEDGKDVWFKNPAWRALVFR